MDHTITVNDVVGKEWAVSLAHTSHLVHFFVYINSGEYKLKLYVQNTVVDKDKYSLFFVSPRLESRYHFGSFEPVAKSLADRLNWLQANNYFNFVEKIKESLTIEQKAELADAFLDGCTYLRRYL